MLPDGVVLLEPLPDDDRRFDHGSEQPAVVDRPAIHTPVRVSGRVDRRTYCCLVTGNNSLQGTKGYQMDAT